MLTITINVLTMDLSSHDAVNFKRGMRHKTNIQCGNLLHILCKLVGTRPLSERLLFSPNKMLNKCAMNWTNNWLFRATKS